MKQPIVLVGRDRRKKTRANKPRHKQARIRELLLDRKAEEKAAANLDRKLGRSNSRAEAAFKGCDL